MSNVATLWGGQPATLCVNCLYCEHWMDMLLNIGLDNVRTLIAESSRDCDLYYEGDHDHE